MAEKGITYKEETDPTSSADNVKAGAYGDRPDDYPVGPNMSLPGGSRPSMALPGSGEIVVSRTMRRHARSVAHCADSMSQIVPGCDAKPTGVLGYGGSNQKGSN